MRLLHQSLWFVGLTLENIGSGRVSYVEWSVTGSALDRALYYLTNLANPTSRTILSSAGDDGDVRLYKQCGSVWRPVGRFSTEQADDGDESVGH